MTFILWIIFILSFLMLCKLFSKHDGYYSTVAVFGLGCYLYYIGIPFELAYIGPTLRGVTFDELSYLSAFQLNLIALLGIIAFWSFAFGYRLSGFTLINQNEAHMKNNDYPLSFAFLAIISIGIIIAVYPAEVLSLRDYDNAVGVTYKNPVLSLLSSYFVIPLSIIGGALLRMKESSRNRIGYSIVGLIFAWGVFSSDKDPLLIAVLCLVSVYAGMKKMRIFYLFAAILGVVLILLGIILFSVYRGGGDLFDFGQLFRLFGLRNLDPAGPLLTIVDSINSNDQLKYGSTYLDSLKLLVPKVLWPDRPLDLAEAYATAKMTDWSEGKGYGFSPLAEAVLNFSYIGAFIQYFLFGLLWGLFWKKLRKILWHLNENVWKSLYCILGYYLLMLFHRTPIAGTFKTTFQLVVVCALITIIYDQVLHRYAAKRVAQCSGENLSGS